MKVIVSACLMGENCKYDGGNNYSEKMALWLAEKLAEGEFVDCIPVCPEMLGGLPAPRNSCEIVDGIVKTADGTSCDEEFRKGAQIAWELASEEKPDLAILQSRSPSCGVGKIYDGTFSGKLIEGNGVFAQLLIEKGIKTVDIDKL